MNEPRKKLDIYVDGSCSGNPGPIGYAAVCEINGKILAARGNNPIADGTNNKSELKAVIVGLKAVTRPSDITFYTDSNYIIMAIRHDDAWLTEEGRANRDSWIQIIEAVKRGGHKVSFVKIKGHSGNRLNELADKLAKAECVKARHKLYGRV